MAGSFQDDQINITAVNVNSIIAHHRRLKLNQLITDHNLKIVLLSETKLNAAHRISLTDHDIIRTDRPNATRGGGTVIVIKRNILYTVCNFPTSKGTAILEFTIVKLLTGRNNNLYIISVYAKNYNRDLFIKELNGLFDSLKLQNNNNYFIIAGDFNARRMAWGDRVDNQWGIYMGQWELSHGTKFKLKIPDYAISPYF